MKYITDLLMVEDVNDVLLGIRNMKCPQGDMYCVEMFKAYCGISFQCEYFVETDTDFFCLYKEIEQDDMV